MWSMILMVKTEWFLLRSGFKNKLGTSIIPSLFLLLGAKWKKFVLYVSQSLLQRLYEEENPENRKV